MELTSFQLLALASGLGGTVTPAYAGMTGSGAGMTAFTSGQRLHFQGDAFTCVIARSEATWQSMLVGDDGLPRVARNDGERSSQ